jgi:hypothetical protein
MAYNQIKVSELGYYDTIRNLILTKEEVWCFKD